MCLERTILSDSKPIGTLMNFTIQLWLNHKPIIVLDGTKSWDSWKWKMTPTVMHLICSIAPVSYRHLNVQNKPPVELQCSDLIGNYHIIYIYNVYTLVDQMWIRLSWESAQTLLKFTRLASGKSLYMVIIGPNSHLTKCAIKSGWSRFNHCSTSLVYHLSWKSLVAPIHMKRRPKSKWHQV